MIPVYKPYLPAASLKYAHEALDSSWVSSQGKFLLKAQEKLQDLLDIKHVLLTNTGTAACHLMARSVMFKNSKIGSVIVPNNVYVAAWNAFLFDKQFKFFPLDADLNTWNVSLEHLEKTITMHEEMRDKFCVLIVHNIGNIINVPELKRKFSSVMFVEDNCEGFLGKYDGYYSGTQSLCSAISFFGNKNITSGEGGALITNDSDLYEHALCLKGQGQSKERFIHTELGYNYRMTNIEAAILCGQLECLREIMEKKAELFYRYRNLIQRQRGILCQEIPNNTEHSNWMFGVRVLGNRGYGKTEEFFAKAGVEIRPMFYPIMAHAYLTKISSIAAHVKQSINATVLNKECFILPSYPSLSISEQNHIVNTLISYKKEA